MTISQNWSVRIDPLCKLCDEKDEISHHFLGRCPC